VRVIIIIARAGVFRHYWEWKND